MTNKDDNQRNADQTSSTLDENLQSEKQQQNTSEIDDEMNG